MYLAFLSLLNVGFVYSTTLSRKSLGSDVAGHRASPYFCHVGDTEECHFSYMRSGRLPPKSYPPNYWFKCKTGEWKDCKPNQKLQSPINIVPSKAEHYRFWPRYIYPRAVAGTIENNGHSATFTTHCNGEEQPNDLVLKNVPHMEDTEYIFYEMHFHIGRNIRSGSEHSVNGGFYNGEIHFVHWKRDNKIDTHDKAATSLNGLVVTAIFFTVDLNSRGNSYIDRYISTYVKPIKETHRCGNAFFNPNAILPKGGCIYTYAGSKTTPPCNENVRFLIYSEPITISLKSYKILAALRVSDGPELFGPLGEYGNDRPIQHRPVDDLEISCRRNPRVPINKRRSKIRAMPYLKIRNVKPIRTKVSY